MRKIILLTTVLLLTGLWSLGQEHKEPGVAKVMRTLNKFSFTSTMGTNSFSPDMLKQLSPRKAGNISLGQLGISYKLNKHLSVGISTFGSLGNCQSGYFNAEGGFTPLGSADDMDDDDGLNDVDDLDGPNDLDDKDDMDAFDDCDDDDGMGQNLMGTVTILFSEKLPIFLQTSGGYSFSQGAPAITTMLGYRYQIISGLGLVGGIRYSDVLYKVPAAAFRVNPSSGIKAELGLSWNF